MQLKFQTLRNHLYAFDLTLPADHTAIIQELENETWVPDKAGYGQSEFATRYRVRQVQNTLTYKIEQYVEHGEFKQQIIDQLYQDPGFAAMWGVSPERMDQQTFIYGVFTKDMPGYLIRMHTDDRMHVCQGMIYFSTHDDPDRATTFCTSFEGADPIRIVNGPGQGYVAANTNNNWHWGHNATDQPRHSMIFGIRLNL